MANWIDHASSPTCNKTAYEETLYCLAGSRVAVEHIKLAARILASCYGEVPVELAPVENSGKSRSHETQFGGGSTKAVSEVLQCPANV